MADSFSRFSESEAIAKCRDGGNPISLALTPKLAQTPKLAGLRQNCSVLVIGKMHVMSHPVSPSFSYTFMFLPLFVVIPPTFPPSAGILGY